jgi:hypothetical protein
LKDSDAPIVHQPGFRQQHGHVLLYVYVYTRAAGAEQFSLDFRLRLKPGPLKVSGLFVLASHTGQAAPLKERGRHVKAEEANRNLL